MMQLEYPIQDPFGLHARPAGQIVHTAMRFCCSVTLRKNQKIANAKSILSVMQLEAKQGETLEILCDGADEREATEALKALLQNGL